MINLIGEEINQRLTDGAKERIRDSRVRATKNLVDGIAAAQTAAKVLVSQSAVGYYGDRGEAIVDESSPRPTTGCRRSWSPGRRRRWTPRRPGVRVASCGRPRSSTPAGC